MMEIELSTNNPVEAMNKNACIECTVDFEEISQLKTHIMKYHKDNKRNGRAFNYVLNDKKAKAKLLRGAKRTNPLVVEVKSGCVNMRFNDGSYFTVVLPLLRKWHEQVSKPFKLNDIVIEVEEADPGVESSEKHIDTKLVIIADKDRLVLHAYNSTQGKNYQRFAVD